MTALTPNPSYSINVHLEMPNKPGHLTQVTDAIATAGGNIGDIKLLRSNLKISEREVVVDASSEDHAAQIIEAIKALPDVNVLGSYDRTFALHHRGKIEVVSQNSIGAQSDLAMAYTPGVGRICKAIAADPDKVYDLTVKCNMVAIVTDGSAVLGLGNLGPEGALPVMEGKAMLLKEFAGVDAFPICVKTQNADEIVELVKNIAPVFGGVNLEDISAPRCFEIERRLREETDIPIFHDDQHGTAIVTLAALFNALKVVKKELSELNIVINGAGAAGIAIANLLKEAGATTITMCDSKGIISRDRTDLNEEKKSVAVEKSGDLAAAMVGSDVFIGVSAPGVVTVPMVQSMASDPIVFAMANPIPEIQPELAKDHVAVMATGRSDYPNQINNVLAFPGIFRGALDCRATNITIGMYLAAAKAIASLLKEENVSRDCIVPSVFEPGVASKVAEAVMAAARIDGVARI
jgi:malate dehydrogenase (oxaloacetate-decarboxylating)